MPTNAPPKTHANTIKLIVMELTIFLSSVRRADQGNGFALVPAADPRSSRFQPQLFPAKPPALY